MKFRSYNEQLLIAQALIGNVFNDIVIDRRHHGTERDYSQPISMEDIIQKEIEIPCIFGDKSIILKSLQNEAGAIKLPLYILTSKDLKVDQKREADLHFDIFYQQDECFSKLPKDHPAYRPYSLKKRRGLPVTINYDLTMVTKYREDLDQMMSNWMVHWRPDIYVKWWHPKTKQAPLQAEILWDQNINIDANTDNDGKTKYQWKATTAFTFKTWLFPGLNYYEDSLQADLQKLGKEYEPIVQKFNFYNVNPDYQDINEYDEETGYPVLGEIFDQSNKTDSGFIVVEHDSTTKETQEWHEENNMLYNEPEIEDVEVVYKKYAAYTLIPPINNNRYQIRYVYFSGGFPLSALQQTPPSGDYLFQIFNSDITSRKNISGEVENNIHHNVLNLSEREFGDCITDSLDYIYNYDIDRKILKIKTSNSNLQQKFYANIETEICSDYINQYFVLSSLFNQKPICLNTNRRIKYIDNKFIKDDAYIYNHTENIKLWNDIFNKRHHMNKMHDNHWEKHQKLQIIDDHTYDIAFHLDNEKHIHLLSELKQLIINNIDNLELRNEQLNLYKLIYRNINFWKITNNLNCNRADFQFLIKKLQIIKDNITYSIIANNWLYFVIYTKIQNNQQITDVYDYGIIDLPLFDTVPIFNVDIPQARLVYGLNTQYKIDVSNTEIKYIN